MSRGRRMSTFQRYLRHRVAGSTQDDALVNEYLPLDAGRMLRLANNAQHLLEQNPRRALRQHPGVRDFWAPSTRGTGFTGPPSVQDIRWATSQKDGACCIDLGQFHVWPFPDGSLPRITLRFTAAVEGGYSLGWVFAVAPGERGPLSIVASDGDVTTSATWTEYTESIGLGRGHLAPLSYAPTNGVSEVAEGEAGQLLVFRAFLGGYCSSNSNSAGARASVVGLSLYAEQP